MKTKLNYTVRNTRAPGETRDVIVPVIVERLNPVELETVVANCIDRGLIAGLKTTAAHGIAEGVAAQIAREFSLGRSVAFGQAQSASRTRVLHVFAASPASMITSAK